MVRRSPRGRKPKMDEIKNKYMSQPAIKTSNSFIKTSLKPTISLDFNSNENGNILNFKKYLSV